MIKDWRCRTFTHEFRSWPYGYNVNGRIESVCEITTCRLKLNAMKCIFCDKTVVKVYRVFLEQNFVVIMLVTISYALKKE